MTATKSAEKRVRQNEKARLRNKARKTELKTLKKQLVRAVHDGETERAEELYRRLAKRLDQAASKKVIHANNADRRKARAALVLAGKVTV